MKVVKRGASLNFVECWDANDKYALSRIHQLCDERERFGLIALT